jgi:tetratricopeptide (TPR) repeat protein
LALGQKWLKAKNSPHPPRHEPLAGMRLLSCFCVLALVVATPVMALDLITLWDFNRPDVSEARFRQALESARGDDALILHTQIARCHGLRKDFVAARQALQLIEPAIVTAGPEAQTRFHLEWGRSFASATHTPEQLSTEAKASARQAYETAWGLARAARLDALAIDAIHMFAFLDTAPADQLKWGQAALDVVQVSSQADARRWEASVRHNIGYALHQLGRYDEALSQFQHALALRERSHNADAIHVAHWMVAWTLRSLKRSDEALAIQLRLERSADAAGKPDPFVFEELEILFRARGDMVKADHYAGRQRAAKPL